MRRTIVQGILAKFAVLALLASVASAATPQDSSHHASRKHHSRKHVAKVRGQQKIDPERARQIQQALIREHYLGGEASGVWDDSSQRAMQRFQAENGWQTKEIPDSRALIKLGLGPDHDHLLNPESAMTTPPKLLPAENTPAATIKNVDHEIAPASTSSP